MVLASVYLSVSASLPSTANIKPVEWWLLFNLAFPLLVIIVNVILQVGLLVVMMLLQCFHTWLIEGIREEETGRNKGRREKGKQSKLKVKDWAKESLVRIYQCNNYWILLQLIIEMSSLKKHSIKDWTECRHHIYIRQLICPLEYWVVTLTSS